MSYLRLAHTNPVSGTAGFGSKRSAQPQVKPKMTACLCVGWLLRVSAAPQCASRPAATLKSNPRHQHTLHTQWLVEPQERQHPPATIPPGCDSSPSACCCVSSCAGMCANALSKPRMPTHKRAQAGHKSQLSRQLSRCCHSTLANTITKKLVQKHPCSV